MKNVAKTSQSDRLRIGLLLSVADLYHRLWADIDGDLERLGNQVANRFRIAGIEAYYSPAVSTPEKVVAACRDLRSQKVDLLVVALAPYCPSGVLASALAESGLPLVLWPMQSILRLEPERYDAEAVKLNHGVHAVQDLANVLGKMDTAFGVIHGHHEQPDFIEELKHWARAGRILRSMQTAHPVQIGGHFENMLDLEVGQEEFIRRMGLRPEIVSTAEFADLAEGAGPNEIAERVESYRRTFAVGPDVDSSLLEKTARGEIALRAILARTKSTACGLNFLELCNDERVADGLHVAASILMSEGMGYAGEGDWVIAVLVRGMQHGFGVASFSEIFSIGYADNRLLLKHWGEGNFAMARARPRLVASTFTDRCPAQFAIVDFEFEPGETMLVNLNSTPDGRGQLMSIRGRITEDPLPNIDGPRGVFQPSCPDVRELLTEYAYAGGSHHMALIKDAPVQVLERVCRLAGWCYRGL